MYSFDQCLISFIVRDINIPIHYMKIGNTNHVAAHVFNKRSVVQYNLINHNNLVSESSFSGLD